MPRQSSQPVGHKHISIQKPYECYQQKSLLKRAINTRSHKVEGMAQHGNFSVGINVREPQLGISRIAQFC